MLPGIINEQGNCRGRHCRKNEYFYMFPIKVSKGAKIRNRYNQVPHLTQDTNGKVTNSQHICYKPLVYGA